MKKNNSSNFNIDMRPTTQKKASIQTKRKEMQQKKLMKMGSISLILGVFICSPFFNIQEIVIIGNDKYDKTEILSKIEVWEGDNLIFVNTRDKKEILNDDSYVANVRIKKKFPSTLEISLEERKLRAYVPYMGDYLYIDEEGRVLETRSAYYESLPEVYGLKFSYFRVGEILPSENTEGLEIVLQLSQMMQKYDLLGMTLKIDVSNLAVIQVTVNQVKVTLGTTENIDQKVRTMAEVMKTIPTSDRGTLDLSDLNKSIVFQYLT